MLVVAALGIAFSLGVFQLVRYWDEKRAELHLTLQAQAAASAVRDSGEVCDELLHNLAELMGRRGDLSRAEFSEVTRLLLSRHKEIRSINWAPVVPASERARVEAQAARELGRPFGFTQRNAAGNPEPATPREVYWPVLYIEPLAGSERSLGLDVRTALNRAAHDFACDDADLVLTRPFRPFHEPAQQLSYAAIMPVYRGGGMPAVGPERQARLTGFVHGIFRVGDFLRDAMLEAPPTMLDMMALDLTPESPERLIHYLPAKESAAAAVPTEADMRAGWYVELPMRLGERSLALLFRPAPGALAAMRTLNPYGALASGLLLTVVCAFYLRTVQRRTARVEAEVAARTEELSRANAGLSAAATACELAERGLARQLALLRTLIDAIPDSIYIKDKEGRFLLHNAANRRALGLAPGDEGTGRTVHDFPATKANAEAYDADDRAVLASGQPVLHREEAFTQPDGTPGWFLTTKVPIRDERGEVSGIVGVSRDITVRRQERQALAESEARFRTLFESSPDAVFVESREGIVVDANQSACRLHGLTRAELVGKHVTELVPPDRREAVRQDFPGLFNRESTLLESESLTKDGHVVPIELAACPCEYEGKVAVLLHVRDISVRRRSEAALARRDRILHAVARAAQTLLHAQDWQTVASEMLGELGEATGCSAVCLFANDMLGAEPAFRAHCLWPVTEPPANGGAPIGYAASGCIRWRESFARGESIYGPVNALPASERRLPESKGMKSIALTPVFAGNTWWGFLALGQRETEREWFAGELEALRAAAEVFGAAIARTEVEAERVRFETRLQETQKLESLGVLAGGIAHDFNNLLTSILGNASLARLDLPPHSPADQSLERIETASLRAADLCKQMLAYAGKGRLVVQPVNLTRLVQETAHLLQVSISKRAVLKFDLAQNLPAVMVDASQLRQIVMNLVINASEAIGERSGIIALSTGLVRADRGYLADTRLAGDLPEGDYVFLEVSDTGCGMTPEIQARIFEPFYTTKFTGRGLGLAAVLGIVRGHRGALMVDSVPGKGSTFRLLLPVARGQVVEVSTPNPLADGWRGHGRILVVDDEETVRAVVARVLESLGFTVTLAADGREAVKIFEAQPEAFTMVVIDLTMPHMDGTEAFARMRQVRSDLRVVLMSGYSEQDATVAFAGKGLAGFLQKPFELGHLRDKVRAVFEVPK
ncbi:MAG: PAS domain S-box protein [Proteobacteria bacterium]|nr:PAS domain S-box protein [Pseudomonadota bacterium]